MNIIINGQDFYERLEELRAVIESDKPLNAIITEVKAWVEQNYTFHGLVLDGEKWAPNSPKWIEQKRKKTGHFMGPGIFLGYLARSFQSDDATRRYDKHHAVYGTRVNYAPYVNKNRQIIGDSKAYTDIYKEAFIEALKND